uniref:Capsid protein n=1 Tax=Corseley virus TaxID=1807806 RepID=A0A140HEQ3_9VIRU|nr:hypothetical protein 3 [Corseley virus]
MKNKQSKKATKASNGVTRRNAPVGAPVSTATRQSRNVFKSQRERGVTQIYSIDKVTNGTGDVVLFLEFDLAEMPRLNLLSDNYLKYRIHKLVYHITPSAPTTVSGTYVTNFIRDPYYRKPTSDPESDSPAAIIASGLGAKSRKWWEDCQIPVNCGGREFFVQEAVDRRCSSPGVFVLANNNSPSGEVGLVITLEYDIEFVDSILSQPIPEPTMMETTAQLDTVVFWQAGTEANGYIGGHDINATASSLRPISDAFPFLETVPIGTRFVIPEGSEWPVLTGYGDTETVNQVPIEVWRTRTLVLELMNNRRMLRVSAIGGSSSSVVGHCDSYAEYLWFEKLWSKGDRFDKWDFEIMAP